MYVYIITFLNFIIYPFHSKQRPFFSTQRTWQLTMFAFQCKIYLKNWIGYNSSHGSRKGPHYFIIVMCFSLK